MKILKELEAEKDVYRVGALIQYMRKTMREKNRRIKLLEASLWLISEPEYQDRYTPQEIAKHALRIEPLKKEKRDG